MKKTLSLILLCLFVLFTLTSILSGCNTYKKQLAKATAFFDANPTALAPICATKFPVKDSIGKATVDSTHKANNKDYSKIIDSVSKRADSLYKAMHSQANNPSDPCKATAKSYESKMALLYDEISALNHGYKPCLPDTVYKTVTIYQTNTAEVAVVQNQLDVKVDSLKLVKHDLQIKTAQSTTRLWWIIGFAAAIAVLIGISVLKLLGKLSFL